ncbi:hypothetical protein MPSEU_001095500 [Mayamaea pseudoterrestris]|nr:hypothetical protein MPSEU_001095500 [Mayamaea pseudoterrestris]
MSSLSDFALVTWKCTECKFLNQADESECQLCRSWKCVSCPTSGGPTWNISFLSACKKCSSLKPSIAAPAEHTFGSPSGFGMSTHGGSSSSPYVGSFSFGSAPTATSSTSLFGSTPAPATFTGCGQNLASSFAFGASTPATRTTYGFGSTPAPANSSSSFAFGQPNETHLNYQAPSFGDNGSSIKPASKTDTDKAVARLEGKMDTVIGLLQILTASLHQQSQPVPPSSGFFGG